MDGWEINKGGQRRREGHREGDREVVVYREIDKEKDSHTSSLRE
jgi:hypothetical protein